MEATYSLIAITVVISMFAFQRKALMERLIMNPHKIQERNEYYRFITSGFIHNDHMHLIFNMFTFYFFGAAVEQIFRYLFNDLGVVYFIALYVGAIIVSDLPTYFKNRNNPAYNSLGASGGVSAVLFAFILFQPLQKVCIFIALCLPGFVMAFLFVAYSWYQGKRSKDGINHEAHLYGALFGLAFCIAVYPDSLPHFIQQIRNWDMFF